jgi:hypothetical protein
MPPSVANPVLGQFPIEQWLIAIGVGVLFGAFGQLVRTVPGTYKRNQDGSEPFSVQVMVLSVVIGATAGALASLFLVAEINNIKGIGFSPLLGLMGAGYAGADFIEGFAGRWMRQGTPAAAAPKPPATTAPTQPDESGAVG